MADPMADPLSVTASILAVGGFALKSSIELHKLVRGVRSQNKDARALKAELGDLTEVLSSLLETIANNPTIDFKALELPLQRCGKACEEYGKIIAECTKHSNDGSRSSIRDWITQKYLQGDINDFKAMIAAYKSTINIALANANIRIAAISPDVLEEYKDMISDTTSDLNDHLNDLQEKIDRLQAGDASAVDEIAIEWQALLEEKESTRQGLEMCAQLSAQIVQFQTSSREHVQFSGYPSAKKHVSSGLGEAKGSIESLITRLQTHGALIDSQLEALSLKGASPEPVAAQLSRLEQTKESINQCIQIVSEARNSATDRSNIFEDLTLAGNSYAFSVSTVHELVTARRLNLEGRSRHFGGQVADETVQRSIEALTQLDREYIRTSSGNEQEEIRAPTVLDPRDATTHKEFRDRFGPGNSLS
ncbi:hypothetical protein B0I35DRAFT_442295 [Stachybotrys elegans]|uniref:Azaphilone pigments biosynthesis cluster protein L N-terminal domain-containing protein n=1 Tax=Stachybotrys elegans TaxID=80388 RepID=A0A8K0SIL3_9HYPO|nr:hypothetical protein B0I35DRAFT_442295 [Stachybotrys elegans]